MNISNRSRILTLSILAPFCIGAASGQGDAKVPDSKMPDIKIDASPLPQSAPSYAPVVEKVEGKFRLAYDRPKSIGRVRSFFASAVLAG